MAELKNHEVRAVFQFTDIDVAKTAFQIYMRDNELTDIEGLLEAIYLMHPFSVELDDPRSEGGMVMKKL